MPQRRTAIKDLRKIEKRRAHNLDIKSDLKRTIKKFSAMIKGKKAKEAQDLLKTLYKKIDKAAKKNIFHKRTAARRKSHFARIMATLKA